MSMNLIDMPSPEEGDADGEAVAPSMPAPPMSIPLMCPMS
ncbi:hypothetical protein SALBM311S_12713 [Streptomyces alboniger]